MATATLTAAAVETAAEHDPYMAAFYQRVSQLNSGGVLAVEFEEEIAYRMPGEGWKRRTFKSERKLAKFIDQVIEDGGEIRHREKF